VCTRRRLSGCERVPPVRPLRQIGRVHTSLRGRALQCGCCRVVPRNHQRRHENRGAPRRPRRSPAPAGTKRAGRSIGRLIGGEWRASGGWGARAAGRTSTGATCVGAVLGVDLGPVGPRGHAEPAGVAVAVLPSVGHAIIISEHAAAEDADAVEGVPIPYDRRHAAAVSPFLRLASGARIPAAALAN
jgi:hypothetical protein